MTTQPVIGQISYNVVTAGAVSQNLGHQRFCGYGKKSGGRNNNQKQRQNKKTEIFQKTGNVPGFNVCLQCLNKCCFITAAVSAGFVEMQGLWILRSCYQHYLVAIAAYGELFCVGKTEPGISSVPILPVCNNILDKCKRTYIS